MSKPKVISVWRVRGTQQKARESAGQCIMFKLKEGGSPSRIRTYGHSINSRMLYR